MSTAWRHGLRGAQDRAAGATQTYLARLVQLSQLELDRTEHLERLRRVLGVLPLGRELHRALAELFCELKVLRGHEPAGLKQQLWRGVRRLRRLRGGGERGQRICARVLALGFDPSHYV